MIKILTYGTFDLLHEGHKKFLATCRKLAGQTGRVIVGVATPEYHKHNNAEQPYNSFGARCFNVRNLFYPVHEDGSEGFGRARLVDIVFQWRSVGQLTYDIRAFRPDLLVLGEKWEGNKAVADIVENAQADLFFDVVYVERTPGISSSMLRAELAKGKRTKAVQGVYYFTDN